MDIDVDHPLPLVALQCRERGEGHDPGIVDERIDPAKARFCSRDESIETVGIDNVEVLPLADLDLTSPTLQRKGAPTRSPAPGR